MANIILSRTRAQIRQAVGALINQVSPFSVVTAAVASSGSSVTIVVTRLKSMPQQATELFVGAQFYVYSGTGTGQNFIVTAFDPTTGTLTYYPAASPALDSTSRIELYSARAWNKEEIDAAIDLAFVDGGSRVLWPIELAATAFETGIPIGSYVPSYSVYYARSEYPVPSQFLYMGTIDYDLNNPILGYGPGNWTGGWEYIANSEVAGSISLVQPLVTITGSSAWVNSVSLYLLHPVPLAVNSGTAPTTVYARINGVSVPDASGTTSTLSTSRLIADISAIRPHLVTFTFPRPVLLVSGGTYSISLGYTGDSTTITPETGVAWCTDSANLYRSGQASTVSPPVTPTAFASPAVSFLFWMHTPQMWRPLSHQAWDMMNSDVEPQVHFDSALFVPVDGTLIRFRGARAALDFTGAADSATPEVAPSFLIYRAASLLMSGRLLTQGASIESQQAMAAAWNSMAEQQRQPFTIPFGATDKVR